MAERNRAIKLVFAAGALGCVLAGLLLYVFADELGFDPDEANFLAMAFLAAGFADYLLLRFWDRIFRSRQNRGGDR